jgi:uncharacterized protein (DUF58 family)
VGAGQEFATHTRMFDCPDPRRIDIRASLRTVRQEWLVRLHRQRVAVPVHAVIDVSASMHFGTDVPKLHVAADFVEALGHSAFRVGDPVGMHAFDADARDDLFVPARHARGVSALMAAMLRDCTARSDRHTADAQGLQRALVSLAGKTCLVFLVSDFHWPLTPLPALLDTLVRACVVPIVVWDRAETEPPAGNGWLALSDVESGARRSIWMRDTTRRQWREQIAARRDAIVNMFSRRGVRPFFIQDAFDPDALSRYFLESFV